MAITELSVTLEKQLAICCAQGLFKTLHMSRMWLRSICGWLHKTLKHMLNIKPAHAQR